MSQERVLHFKSAEDFMEYNGTFGTGDIREGVVQGLQHLARGTALMKGLGPNPEAMITKLKKMYADKAQKKVTLQIILKVELSIILWQSLMAQHKYLLELRLLG